MPIPTHSEISVHELIQQLAPTSKKEMTSRYTTQLGPAQIHQTGGQRQLGVDDLVASGLRRCVRWLCPLVLGPWLEPGFWRLRCPWLPSDPLKALEALSRKLGPGAFAPQASLFTLTPVFLLAPQFMSPARRALTGWRHQAEDADCG